MAAISTLTIHGWRGTVQGERKPVDVITRAGVAGTGLLVGAYQGTPSAIETDYYGTSAECATWEGTADSLVGSSVSVTDAFGAVWTDVGILSVSYARVRAKGLPSTATHVVRATWTMIAEY